MTEGRASLFSAIFCSPGTAGAGCGSSFSNRIWVRFSTLMSKLCGCCNNLFRERWVFAVEVGTAEELRQMLLSVLFLGIKDSFCSYSGKESLWGCALIVQMQSSGVTDRWEVEKAQIHLYNQWKVSQRGDRFFHTCASFPEGVDPQDSRTDWSSLHKSKI